MQKSGDIHILLIVAIPAKPRQGELATYVIIN